MRWSLVRIVIAGVVVWGLTVYVCRHITPDMSFELARVMYVISAVCSCASVVAQTVVEVQFKERA